ncbi:MAG TPA: tetratricopeptide repeat protein [Gemmatimonadales bacterium]|jgi:tetratricopeptide (TPR) repeat protein
MDVSVAHLLGQARERFANQDYYGAGHLLEEIIGSGRAFADVHHLLGLCRSLLGQHERAIEEFDRALALNPRYIEAHIHRGIALSELGRTEAADAAFRQAAENDQPTETGFSRHVAAQLANQHAGLGEAYAEAGALSEAVTQYARAVELGPDFHDVRYRLARLLLERGNALEARVHLEQIVAANPEFVDARAALGLAHYMGGDPQAARLEWRAVLERRPGHARATAYLSMLGRMA